jgi:hypothetical protein
MSKAVAIEAPDALGGTIISGPGPYEANIVILYDLSTPDILLQITKLDEVSIPGLDPLSGGTYSAVTLGFASGGAFTSGTSAFTALSGLSSGATGDFQYGIPFRAKISLEAETGYTFKATSGALSYFAVDDPEGATNRLTKEAKQAYIEDFLAGQLYYGTIVDKGVQVNDLYLNGDTLVLDVSYTVKPAAIDSADIALGSLGDLARVPTKDLAVPSLSTTSSSTKYTSSLAWKKLDADGALIDAAETTFAASTSYKAVITVTPKEGYTFAASTDAATLATAFTGIAGAIGHDSIYGTGSAGSAVINLATGAIKVDGFIIDVVGETAATIKAKDKLVITLTFDKTGT